MGDLFAAIWDALRTWPEWVQILVIFSTLGLGLLTFHAAIFILKVAVWGILMLIAWPFIWLGRLLFGRKIVARPVAVFTQEIHLRRTVMVRRKQ